MLCTAFFAEFITLRNGILSCNEKYSTEQHPVYFIVILKGSAQHCC